MKTHQITVVEHHYKNGDAKDIEAEPDEITSEFTISYNTELQCKIAHEALAKYVAERGLSPWDQMPVMFLPEGFETSTDLPSNMPGAGWCQSGDDHWSLVASVHLV